MKSRDYTISILKDYSRLDEIYQLTHDTFVLSGEILPQGNGKVVSCPQLDKHPNTSILIAEQNDKIIGTISATVDSEVGLNIDSWFLDYVSMYRQDGSSKLSSSWRLATDPSYRGSKQLVIDLIATVLKLLIEAGCNTLLCALLDKHINFYQKLMNAKLISTKKIDFNSENTMELTLMEINLEDGWNTFKQLKNLPRY